MGGRVLFWRMDTWILGLVGVGDVVRMARVWYRVPGGGSRVRPRVWGLRVARGLGLQAIDPTGLALEFGCLESARTTHTKLPGGAQVKKCFN